jgi:hypothetical protein
MNSASVLVYLCSSENIELFLEAHDLAPPTPPPPLPSISKLNRRQTEIPRKRDNLLTGKEKEEEEEEEPNHTTARKPSPP